MTLVFVLFKDVLGLPSVEVRMNPFFYRDGLSMTLITMQSLARYLDFWLPATIDRILERDLRRAIVSCFDILGPSATRLDVYYH